MMHNRNDEMGLKQKRRVNQSPRQVTDRKDEILNNQVNYLEDGLGHMRLPFAYKLHILLCDVESAGFQHIISWVEDGKAFKIHDPHTFEKIIQPRYFRQSKIASFIRQCYIYGFSKIEKGPSHGSYVHPDFHKTDQTKTLTIKRHSTTGTRRPQRVLPSHSPALFIPTYNKTLVAQVGAPSCVPTPLGSKNVIISRDPSPIIPSKNPTIGSQWNVGMSKSFSVAMEYSSLFEGQQTMSIGDCFGNVSVDESEFEPRPIELMLRSFYVG